ncbi:MAG TPA: class I SAM-dependent methyltransferase [Phycisphaerae bacterium]|nr:class I SAM-dependent methyltransferase [Phycisphaerae bacterium]HNU43874.1 class I SAM-dependent methyltransferase [Phycisphaerae bacterium]
MTTPVLWPYQSPADHEAISAMVRQRSTNTADVREVALAGLDLAAARRVLDLGCGFGFLAEALAPRLPATTRVLGVDVWASNREPFLSRLACRHRTGAFECLEVQRQVPWPRRSFDLVTCSYSLYFFPDIIPEVARVLSPEGIFLVITHSEHSFRGLFHAAGLDAEGSRLRALLGHFSAENGEQKLAAWFEDVRRVDYKNELRFERAHLDELLAYVRFKVPLLFPGARADGPVPPAQAEHVRATLSRRGTVIIEKDDAIFHCRRPRCP